MAEYIDRQKLLEEINLQKAASRHSFPRQHFVVGDVLELIRIAPVEDVAPVVHGKWEVEEDIFGDDTYICSVCKEPWVLITGTPQNNNMNYCPNCGAKMDLE